MDSLIIEMLTVWCSFLIGVFLAWLDIMLYRYPLSPLTKCGGTTNIETNHRQCSWSYNSRKKEGTITAVTSLQFEPDIHYHTTLLHGVHVLRRMRFLPSRAT